MFRISIRIKPSPPRDTMPPAMGGGSDSGLVRYGEGAEHLLDDRDQHEADVILVEMKRLAAQSSATAERFVLQARQAFAYIAGFFTIAQAAAVAALGQTGIGHTDRRWMVIAGIAAGAGVIGTGLSALLVERVRTIKGVGVLELKNVSEDAESHDVTIELMLANYFASEVNARERVLRDRLRWLKVAHLLAALTIVLVGGELIVALAAQI
jgi:hypothetical protein